MQVDLPANGWSPRAYQLGCWRYLQGGGKRAYLIWHRRSGKDETSLHWTACAAHLRVGNYWHMLPQASQARKAIWDAVNPHTGRRRIDEAFPLELRATTRDNEMMIKFHNGSTWQVVGSDNYNALVGSPPVGIVFSEWSRADPHAWAFLRPILLENGGWAVWITTPYGDNHAHRMLRSMREDGSAYVEVLPATATGIFTKEALEAERVGLLAEHGAVDGQHLFEQEYLCSFDAPVIGSIFGPEVAALGERLGQVPWVPERLVSTAWDIGYGDATAVWFFQWIAGELRVIDYHEASGKTLVEHIAVLRSKPYSYDLALMPHDAGDDRFKMASGKTLLEIMHANGLRAETVAKLSREQGINQARMRLKSAWFDAKKCERGIECLRNYRWGWSTTADGPSRVPVHDWACFSGETELLTRNGMRQIMDLPETGEVMTQCGWKRYENPHVTRRNAPLVAVTFSDGSTVRCTPDHLFLTDSGWRYANALRKGSLIQSYWTRLPNTSMAGYTGSGRKSDITREGENDCIETCGEVLSAQSLMAATFTTETETKPTICWRIWSALKPQSIYRSLGARLRAAQWFISLSGRDSRLPNGMDLKLGGFGINGMLSGHRDGKNGSERTKPAPLAGSFSRLSFVSRAIRRSIAAITARRLSIVAVENLHETADVWCLTVPEVGHFSLANGAIVHNSHGADSFRYLAVGIKNREAGLVAKRRRALVYDNRGLV